MSNLLHNNLVVRTLSGIVFLAVVLGCIFLSPYAFLSLLVIICIGSMLELYKLAGLQGVRPLEIWPALIGCLLILLAFFVKLHKVPGICFVALLPMLALLFVSELYRKQENPFGNIAWSVLGIIYIALPMALLAYMPVQPAMYGYVIYRPLIVLNVFVLVWANDVGAYLLGMMLGRHKMIERISPKKTWEGFAGGILCAAGVGVLLAHLAHMSIALWLGAAVVIALSGVAGDLVESMLKRSVGVKDSGQMMPGHGGFLDRFDALFMAVPFIFTYLIIFA